MRGRRGCLRDVRSDQRVDLGRMGQRAHVARTRHDREPRGARQQGQCLGNQPRRRRRVLAADDQGRTRQARVVARARRLLEQGGEFGRRHRHPARERVLRRGTHRGPCARPAPIVDEGRGRVAVVAGHDAGRDRVGNRLDLGQRRRGVIELPQQVERGGLIEREARDAIRPRERGMQRDAATVGVADQMDLTVGAVDQRNGARSLIGEREGMLAGPGAGAVAAIVLGRDQVVTPAQRLGEPAPLCRHPRRSSAARSQARAARLASSSRSRGSWLASSGASHRMERCREPAAKTLRAT